MCLLPALECLNGRMDETLYFLLSERKGKFFNYVECQVLRQTVHANIFVRSQTAFFYYLKLIVGTSLICLKWLGTGALLCHNP